MIQNILKNLQGNSDKGLKIANQISAGKFENIEGYYDLLKKLDSNDLSMQNQVAQAFDKAEELVANGTEANSLRFEHDLKTGFHDVDIGIKDSKAANGYLEAYQFKTLEGKLNADKITGASKQLRDVISSKKIVELICPFSTLSDLSEPGVISSMKFSAANFGITEFHFIIPNFDKQVILASSL